MCVGIGEFLFLSINIKLQINNDGLEKGSEEDYHCVAMMYFLKEMILHRVDQVSGNITVLCSSFDNPSNLEGC